jgi:hypothetical protein
LSATSAARSIRLRLVPCAIAATVPIEQGHTTIPPLSAEPEAGSAPRLESSKTVMLDQSPPVAFLSPASSWMPHSSSIRRHPCFDTMSHVGTLFRANSSSSRTPYGAPEAPVIAREIGS